METLDLLEYKRIATRLLKRNGLYATAKAVEKSFDLQIPKKPSVVDYGFLYYKCPNCGEDIFTTSEFEDHHNCLNCGQRLDWSEGEGV